LTDIKDVAKLAKVSIASVSRYLNKPEIVKPLTRKRIQEAINILGYRPSLIAQSMRSQASKYIAMILEDMSNPFYTDVLNGAEESALESGYNIVVLNINRDIKKKEYYSDIVFRRGFAGVIYCFTMYKEDEKILKNLKDKDIHFVLIENELFKDKYTCINTDNFKAGYKGTEYLINKGHKNIAIVGFNSFHDQVNSRKKGYVEALREYSLKYNPEFVFNTTLNIEGGEKIGEEVYKKINKLDSVFCFSDLIAVGLMKKLKSLKVKIPDDISILGFDNIELTKIVDPTLSTVHQKKKLLGAKAVESIISSKNNTEEINSIILDVKIIERESIKVIRGIKK